MEGGADVTKSGWKIETDCRGVNHLVNHSGIRTNETWGHLRGVHFEGYVSCESQTCCPLT